MEDEHYNHSLPACQQRINNGTDIPTANSGYGAQRKDNVLREREVV